MTTPFSFGSGEILAHHFTSVTEIPQFTCTRKIEIDTAHRVPDHGSKCFNIHGHRYVIECTLVGPTHTTGYETGMVMDFGFLKQLMMQEIYDHCDHALILSVLDPLYTEGVIRPGYGIKLHSVPFSPTAENLAKYWHEVMTHAVLSYMNDCYPGRSNELYPTVARVRVYETPNCWSDYPHVL